MNGSVFSALLLALVWGALWASFLQFSQIGRWLVHQRTWLTVVVGVGVDVLILFPFLTLNDWLLILAVIGTSSVGMIARSLYNEHQDHSDGI